MPEKSHRDNGKAVQSIEPQQSSWFTHWTGTRFESSTHDPSRHHSRNEEDDLYIKKHPNEVEIASDNFNSLKDLELAMSLKKPDNTQSFPFFKRGNQETGRILIQNEGVQALKPQFSHKKPTTALNIGSSSRESHFQPQEVSHVPSEHVKYHMFFGESHTTTHKTEKLKTKSVTMQQEQNIPFPSFLRKDNVSLLKTDPSTSTNFSPTLMEEQYKRMQKHIGMGFFPPHQTGCPEMIKPGAVQSFQNVPYLQGVHSFSRTTHSLLITKQTDVELYQEKQIFRESMQLKQEALREVNRSPQYFGHGQRGVKLQLLENSDQESMDKIEDGKGGGDVQKNESSADTDTMDMESFKENHVSGLQFSPRKKETTVESNIPNLPLSKPNDTRGKRKIELPDINLEISSNSTEKPEPCTSRTQSLDINTLNFNLDHTTRSEECSDGTTNNHGSEPSNRWIKRLKLTGSGGPGSGSLPKTKHFTKTTEENPGPLEMKVGECRDDDKEAITLSHAWIQRWSRNQGQKGPVEKCKVEECKVGPEEFEKKQFPSIAAMALMGKAMSGFQQCKFQKKESFVVWNTKGFE